jgi:ectoine hydroxylase-related dioxygenase (phytanoyl-CoA dioxygenase family)
MSFPALDFDAYHRDELPRALAAGRDALAARAARGLGALALRIRDGGAWSYRPAGDRIEIAPGDADADTVIELDRESWQGLVHELEAPAGLLYAGRIRCLRGHAMNFMAWEAGLRALYNGRPLYDAASLDLRDRNGAPLDVARSFTLADDREELRHFLAVAGFAFVRGVFDAGEVAAFRGEAESLRGEARKGDKLSWWGKNAAGEEILCRVTRASAKPRLATLMAEPRLRALAELASERLVHRRGEGEGVTVIYKHPQMTEGLGDLPWHRDCGMGGHAAMCPVLIASVYLTAATPESGTLAMLPGSHTASFGTRPANHPSVPPHVALHAEPGDVSIHYSDTMHAAPPPTAADRAAYRISAIVGFARPDAAHHRGEKSYNDVLHGREDGQVEHLERVAERA